MPTLHLITGDDLPAIATTARRLADELAGPDADAFSREVFRESEALPPASALRDLLQALRTPPFLGGRKTVWLQDFSAFDEEPAKNTKPEDCTAVGLRLQELARFLDQPLPADLALVLSGPGVDKRKALYRACAATGAIHECKRPDLRDRHWREDVRRLIQQTAAAKDLLLDPAASEYLLEVIGTDTGRLAPELEKLACFAGPAPTLEQVRTVCTGTREAYFFAFTDELGHRRLRATWEALAQTLHHTRDADGECIRLTRMTAKYFRKLLHARVALAALNAHSGQELQRRWAARSPAAAERLRGSLLDGATEWQVRNLGEQASHFAGDELQEALRLLGEADQRAVSTALPRRLGLELLVVRIVGGRTPPARPHSSASA